MAYALVYTTIDDETTSLTGYTGTPTGTITVPDEEGGRRVVSIGASAFFTQHITGLVIGANVTSVGSNAFVGTNITTVTGGNSLQTIGTYAFAECESLSSFVFGINLISLGEAAFLNCAALLEATIPAGLSSIGKDCFFGCTSLVSITFLGNAPEIVDEDIYVFYKVSATVKAFSWATGFSNPFYGLAVVFEPYNASLFPSGYDTLALSIWGINLGVPRPYYDSPAVPFTDAMYSRLLLARIMLLNMTGSMADINKYIAFLFPDRRVTVVDNLNMTITYWFPSALTAEETALLGIDGVLPRPAGVEAIIDIEDSDKTIFSFEGMRAGNFDQSDFVGPLTIIVSGTDAGAYAGTYTTPTVDGTYGLYYTGPDSKVFWFGDTWKMGSALGTVVFEYNFITWAEGGVTKVIEVEFTD